MDNNISNTVYILSGPAGIGKSTISKLLARTLSPSAYISGDIISHMHVNGREKPWESDKELSLIWDNILSLTQNFIKYGNNVVIDYVTFPKEASWLFENVKELSVTVIYVVLWADRDTVLQRDAQRKPEHQMGERCLILIDEFLNSGLDANHLLNTTETTSDQMDLILEAITNNPKYVMK